MGPVIRIRRQAGAYKVKIFDGFTMPSGMCDSVIEAAREAFDEFGIRKDSNEEATAAAIKQSMEGYYPGEWYCVVGQRFGCSMRSCLLIRFYMGFFFFFLSARSGSSPGPVRVTPSQLTVK